MSGENSKLLSEETNVDELHGAIEVYKELADMLYNTLGCGCGRFEELCWNCSKANKHYKHITEVYK